MISSLEPFSRQSRERTAAGRSSYGSARSRVAGGLLILAGKRAADHQALDVVGALVDLGDPHGAENALDAVIRDVAGAAQRLDGIRADAAGDLVGRARHAQRLRGDADAPALEIDERDVIALPLGAEPILDRHPQPVQANLAGVGCVLP